VFRISKQHHFSASHRLTAVPEGHPCGRLHGHNYVVELILEGVLDPGLQWVRDFGDLSQVFRWIDENWDHRDLDQWASDQNGLGARHGGVWQSTAENLASYLFLRFSTVIPELAAVRVSETPKTWAEYRRD
jgi:6-pyruvoyltetrahydropterin/6-carboxytetrahydropterin synthase